ncbi:sulfate transporter 3.1-like isoform X1 [Tripterygium wilfordii]|uniref:Sulfate transporter 3.1-like isoform X1 n=1 Tax=Tripterygium wilfordii TaxID=458696 RepID=A0A7J7D6C1_TRIWF|nr:sulfate transporter 3.1-like isoform X1 [Tripterygium wilfordii]
MGNVDYEYGNEEAVHTHHHLQHHQVEVPPRQPFFKSLKYSLKETFFPDDPLRQFKNQPPLKRFILGVQYFLPIFEWGPRYTFQFFKADLISGITIASLAIPQGISYAKLANLPPILGLYSSFVPPLIYAMMGSSRDLAVGTVAVASLLTASMLGDEVSAKDNPTLYLHLAFTATFFAGVFQASLGLLRLGFIVDFLSHATIVGLMAGAATVVCLQQLKGILGLDHFTHATDVVSVMRSVFSQTHEWRWESGVLGCCFLFFLLVTRYFSKKRPKFFWISAMAPLTSVILGTLVVYLTHAEKHGVQVIGDLKKGLNPPSIADLVFTGPYMSTALKTGIVTGIIALAEGIAVGRSFAMFKNYHIDGNKEMIAIGTMNIVGSCTSCYLTTAVGNIDTSGIGMLEETKKILDRRDLKIKGDYQNPEEKSTLYKLEENTRQCEAGERLNGSIRNLGVGIDIRDYIVGGVGYPLLPWLVTPHKSDSLAASALL